MPKNIFHFLRDKNIKAVFFDMDGTLFDSEVGSIEMMMQLALEKTGKASSVEMDELLGLSYHDKMEKILGYEDTEILEEAILKGNQMYSEITEPIEGVNKCLSKLKQNNLLLAICTNGYPNMLQGAFAKLEVQVDHVQGSYGINKKPEPDIYQHALKHFNIKPEEALVVEDSMVGITSALSAGIPEENILIFDSAENHQDSEQKFTSWLEFSEDDRIEPRNNEQKNSNK